MPLPTKSRPKSRAFTLIEVCIAIALLGMLAGLVGWQLKKMVHLHHFRGSVALFLEEMQKLQIVALSRRCDLTVEIKEEMGKWSYFMKTDEPIQLYGKERKIELEGVQEISFNQKFPTRFSFAISPAGRIDPPTEIQFFSAEKEEENQEKITVDLKHPLIVHSHCFKP